MSAVVVDANVLIASRLPGDQYHATGRKITTGIEDGDLPSGHLPRDVLAEVLNYLHSQRTHTLAVDTLTSVTTGDHLTVIESTVGDFDAARSLFERYSAFSFTDAVLAAYARRTGIQYLYSFDDDFDAVPWVTRLNVPVNPLT